MRVLFPSRPDQTLSTRHWRWWLAVWAPALIAVLVICAESTETLSAENTSGWLRPLFEHIFGRFQDANWDILHHYIRKSGHFVGYGTVGLTFLRAWLYTLGGQAWASVRSWRVRSMLLAIASTAVIASCDEFHQTFLPGRTGTPVDVVLDTCGATTLCLLVWLMRFRSRSDVPPPVPADA